MAVFQELWAELVGLQPALSPSLAQKFVNRAWRNICDDREWSFLIATGGFSAPASISTGSVTLTQNSPTVVVNAAADAVLAPLVGGTPDITLRQFRIGTASLYNILSYTTATKTLALDRPVLEPGGAGQGYSVYQAYFPPPPQALINDLYYDFSRWISVLDPANGIDLAIETSAAWLDWKDPQRTVSDLAYGVFDRAVDVDGNPTYEFWPHPVAGQTFTCIYKRRGADFTFGGAPLPQIIPDGLVINRALYRSVYPWCAQQAGRQPALAKTNWAVLIREARADYAKDLQQCKLQDDNLRLSSLIIPQGNQTYDGKFVQGHDMNFFGTRF